MGISHLHSIFKPQRIALIGVKNDPNSVGGITLKNLVGGGFNGVVYPVNPKHEAVLPECKEFAQDSGSGRDHDRVQFGAGIGQGVWGSGDLWDHHHVGRFQGNR
jgi:hypothetical protein